MIAPSSVAGDAASSLRKSVWLLVSVGCAHALLFLASYALLSSAPGPHAPDEELVSFYQSGSHRRVVLGGLYVMSFAGIAFVWFCATLRELFHSSAGRGGELVSGVQFVSGILYVALFFTAAAAESVTAVSSEFTSAPLDPMLARLFPQFGATLLLVFAMRMAAMFVFTTSRLARSAGVLPRWFVHASFVCALVLLFSATFSRALVLIFPVWLIVLCALIVWRKARPAAHRAVITALAACAFAGAAHAQDSDEDWKFTLTPYLWGVGFDGSLTFDGQEIEGDGTSSGFPGELSLLSGFLGHFEANKGPWSYALSPLFVSIAMDAEDTPPTDTNLEISGAVVDGFAAYEFAPGWDVLGGVRYYDLETFADITVAGVPQPSLHSGRSWLDPIVGVRYEHSFSRDWRLNARADVGGFGVGSDFAWNTVLAVGYDLSDWARLQLGYRVLDFDFADGTGTDHVDYNVRLSGPLIGVTFSL